MSAIRIAQNFACVREQIAAAAQHSGRTAQDVKLVAVTKYVDVALTQALADAGCRELGESRPQDLWPKAQALADANIHWHLVGHLQRNKVRRTLPLVSLIHSVDSLRTVAAIDRVAGELGLRSAVLLEINTSGEANKSGMQPGELPSVLEEASALEHVEIQGLMTMAALAGGDEVARRNFSDLRQLRDSCQRNLPANVHLKELSMGMSGDFEIAIEEGATIVRIGSALFAGVNGAST
jgi:pyridoxal phosphate enzyme (YggS family)